MGRVEAILAVALALSMAGCVLSGKPKTVAAVPPQPQPAVEPKPAPPPEPLSIFQTQVQLPPPQPVNQEAVVALPAAPEPVETAPAPKPVRRTGATPPPKPEVVPPAAATAAPPAEPERAPIQEIVPADERKRYQESADASKREIRQLLEQAKGRRLNTEQKKVVSRILAFVSQAEDAEKRGDMRQADAFAERGLVLAKDLAGGQ
jgi:hypothetical protein